MEEVVGCGGFGGEVGGRGGDEACVFRIACDWEGGGGEVDWGGGGYCLVVLFELVGEGGCGEGAAVVVGFSVEGEGEWSLEDMVF